jgi:quercetin dioxygenase-like cupin family protein
VEDLQPSWKISPHPRQNSGDLSQSKASGVLVIAWLPVLTSPGGRQVKTQVITGRGPVMRQTFVLLLIGVALGAGGMALAQRHEHENGEAVKVIATQNIKEKLDGKEAAFTVVEVTIEPGKSGLPHHHPGPGIVYVMEGKYELGIDDQPTKVFEAGKVFYEPTGALHRVSKNPAAKGRTRLIAVVLHPRDAKEIAIPAKDAK